MSSLKIVCSCWCKIVFSPLFISFFSLCLFLTKHIPQSMFFYDQSKIKRIQTWNNLRVSKWWQKYFFLGELSLTDDFISNRTHFFLWKSTWYMNSMEHWILIGRSQHLAVVHGNTVYQLITYLPYHTADSTLSRYPFRIKVWSPFLGLLFFTEQLISSAPALYTSVCKVSSNGTSTWI